MKPTIQSFVFILIISVLFGGCKKEEINSDDALYPPGTMHCLGMPKAIVDVTNPITGKIWMDRNLGAFSQATSSTDANSFGDLYQWGRRADLHQCRISPTKTTLSSVDQPEQGSFIIPLSEPYDWRSPQNDNLWQGVNGVNNPCPRGYRLPTGTELNAERASWSMKNAAAAFASPLKWPVAGNRLYHDGSMINAGILGAYWSSSVSFTDAISLIIMEQNAFIITDYPRSLGFSVRCLKD